MTSSPATMRAVRLSAPGPVDNLRLTIRLYDTLRRYQQLDDPSAYFLTAWLPDEPMVYDALNVGEYLAFVAGLWQTPPKLAEQRAEELLTLLDLWEVRRQRMAGSGSTLACRDGGARLTSLTLIPVTTRILLTTRPTTRTQRITRIRFTLPVRRSTSRGGRRSSRIRRHRHPHRDWNAIACLRVSSSHSIAMSCACRNRSSTRSRRC